MKIKPVALLLLILSSVSYAQKYDHCGSWRWAIKTLTDKMGEDVLNTKPKKTTINELNALERPDKVNSGTDRFPVERNLVTVKGFIIENKVVGGSDGDHDYHIVVQSEDGKAQLITEIPSPECPEVFANETMHELFGELRETYDEYIGVPPGKIKALDPPVEVEITGVPFWDMPGHGGGHSDNGIEIHPITGIRVVNGDASLLAKSSSGGPFYKTSGTRSNLPAGNLPGSGSYAGFTNSAVTGNTSPLDVFIILLLGAFLGMIGQGIRIWVGISKANANPVNKDKDMKEYIEGRRIILSFVYAFIIGGLTGSLMALDHLGDLWNSKSLLMSIITAGYAGTDFIEGFVNKNLKSSN